MTLTTVSTPDGTLGIHSTGSSVTIGSATSGGMQTIGAKTAVDFTTLTAAGGDIDVTAAAIAGTTLTATTGAAQLTSNGVDVASIPSIDVVNTVSTGTTVRRGRRSAGGVTIGSATSGGTQTVGAQTTLAYTTLKTTAGDIDLTSAGSIAGSAPGDSLEAKGSFDLQGGTTVSATLLTADTGTGTVNTAGAVTLGTVSTPDSTLGVTSTGGSVTIGSATSGGTQTVGAQTTLAYTTLKTTAGDIDLTSAGSIAGSALGDTLDAKGSFDLQGGTTVSGTLLTADTGTGTVDTAGAVTLTTVSTPDGTLGIHSTGSSVTIGSATSGGMQTIGANTAVDFTTLTAAGGDIDVTAAAIAGTTLTATTGAAQLTSNGVDVASFPSIDVVTVSTGTTFGAAALAGGVTIGSATSGGTQTIGAATTLAYATLKTTSGDIDLTSAGSIAGTSTGSGLTLVTDSLEAKGSFDLQGGTTVSATLLTADTGNGTVNTAGAVMLGTVSTPDGTLAVHSTGAGVMLGSATSGGTQTIGAKTTLAYTTLTTTAGDIDLTSAGSITGTSTGSGLTLVTDSLDAKGSFDLQGRTTISATLLTADTGTGTVNTGGCGDARRRWRRRTATLGIQSTGSSVMLGSATSGGTQTVGAQTTLAYTTLTTTAGDIDLTSAGSIAGTSTGSGSTLVTDSLDAKGSFDLQGGTTISATLLTADTGTGTVNTAGR